MKVKPKVRNVFHLEIQKKYKMIVRENKKAYKRSRDKRVDY